MTPAERALGLLIAASAKAFQVWRGMVVQDGRRRPPKEASLRKTLFGAGTRPSSTGAPLQVSRWLSCGGATGTGSAFLCLLFILTGCSDAPDRDRASRGETDGTAPVRATAKIVVDAPAGRVWSVLTDIAAWRTWQADIRRTSIGSAPSTGTGFDWSSGAGTIHSRIALFEPQRRLSWTGHLYWFHAIHVWTLTPLPNGQTLLETNESMSGWPIALLFTSADLLDSDRRWLDFLKKKAESPQHA